jgi:hypothetical protein
MIRQTLYLQMWHGHWRVRKPVPKLLIPIIEQARMRFERAACRDATLAELAHLDTLSSDQLLRESPAVLGDLFQRFDLDPPAPVASRVVPFSTVIAEWSKERKVAPQGERSFTSKAERFITFIREHHRAADADDMARVSPEEVIAYKNELLKTDLDQDTIANHLAALRTLFRMPSAIGKSPLIRWPMLCSELNRTVVPSACPFLRRIGSAYSELDPENETVG